MNQSNAMADSGGNEELDSYQDSMPVGYAEDGTMVMDTMEWADEAIIAGDEVFLNLAPYPQAIFTAPEDIVSEHPLSFSHTLSSPDNEASAQLPQTYHAQPPLDDINPSTTSISNFQTSVNYSESHHLDL